MEQRMLLLSADLVTNYHNIFVLTVPRVMVVLGVRSITQIGIGFPSRLLGNAIPKTAYVSSVFR